MPDPYNMPELHMYSTNNNPCRHFWILILSSEFIFFTLFKYWCNPPFIIDVWFYLAIEYSGIIRVSWKIIFNIPVKNPSVSTTIIFWVPNATNKFIYSHHVNCSDVICIIKLTYPNPNPVIKNKRVRCNLVTTSPRTSHIV